MKIKRGADATEAYLARDRAANAETEIRRLRAWLVDISKGAGPFSRDPVTHANNCIIAMKDDATRALAGEDYPNDD